MDFREANGMASYFNTGKITHETERCLIKANRKNNR